MTKEARALKKALKQEKDLLAFARDFYEKHRKYVRQVLEPVFGACGELATDLEGIIAANEEAAIMSLETFAGKPELNDAFFDLWERDKPATLAAQSLRSASHASA